LNYRTLLRNVEKTLSAIERSDDITTTIVNVGEAVVRNFRHELGIFGGRLYVLRENQYVLERGFGRSRKVGAGIMVSAGYGPLQKAREEGLVLTDLHDPSVDPEFEKRIGVNRFAAVSFGEEKYLLSFDVHPRVSAEDLYLALGIIRTVLDSKLRQEKLEGLINEARRIQQSILPKSVPGIGDYDVHGISRPAELVGGDFYDFLPAGENTFGAAIADASGHGLLAALLVRDVYVGLRMGIGGDLKIARTIERLNRILNKSRLTTKFVSLFYGEFESGGEIVYVNAGHPQPIHVSRSGGTIAELEPTGMVLGPSPAATYGRRAVKMEAGDVMLLYTDGIVEAHDRKGREFGVPRVKKLLVEGRRRTAREIAERIAFAVDAWTGGLPQEDDQTIVVIRRRGPGERASLAANPLVTAAPAGSSPAGE
jgi:sigma-B regulation protein RsbU (phosphoserine phosphatase)